MLFCHTRATETLLYRLQYSALFLSGIAFCYTAHPLLLITPVLLAAHLILTSEQYATYALIACAFFSVGAASFLYQQKRYQSIVQQIPDTKKIYVQGSIEDINTADHKRYRAVYEINVTHLYDNEKGRYLPCAYPWRLRCFASHIGTSTVGDTIQLHGIHANIQPKASFADYLMKEDIHATAFIQQKQCIHLHRPLWHYKRWIYQKRQTLYTQCQKKCSPQTFTLLSLIFFGNRLHIKKNYQKFKDLFSSWGIIHFLARSGLHLIIFVLLLVFCFRWVPLPFIYKQLGIIILSLCYAAFSWSSISFCRALYTFFWYTACRCLQLQIDALYIILAIGGCCLLANPMLLFFLDFQLSFGLTLILSLSSRYATSQTRTTQQ